MLMANQLVGFGAVASTDSVTLVDTISLATDVDGTTFTSTGVGLTGSWTHLIILVSARNPTSVSGVTVNGVSATQVVVASDGTAVSVSAIYIIASSAASPDIAVTWGASATTCHVQVFAVTGLQSTTAVATVNTGTANPSVLSLNTTAGGIAVAGGVCLNATSCAWTGVTETHDSVRETSFNFSGGYALAATSESPRTISGSWSGTANYRITVSASFR